LLWFLCTSLIGLHTVGCNTQFVSCKHPLYNKVFRYLAWVSVIILLLCIANTLLCVGCLCSLHTVNWLSVVLWNCFKVAVGRMPMCLLNELSVLFGWASNLL
jgi:hypothetical protein